MTYGLISGWAMIVWAAVLYYKNKLGEKRDDKASND